MRTRTVWKLLAGIASLAVVALIASTLGLRARYGSWSQAWWLIQDASFLTSTVFALVWSTGLARTYGLGRVRTGVLGLLFGVVVLFATSLLVEALWPAWAQFARLDLDRFGAMVRHDAAWFGSKIALCALYTLPFAVWRTAQRQTPLRAGPSSSSLREKAVYR